MVAWVRHVCCYGGHVVDIIIVVVVIVVVVVVLVVVCTAFGSRQGSSLPGSSYVCTSREGKVATRICVTDLLLRSCMGLSRRRCRDEGGRPQEVHKDSHLELLFMMYAEDD